MALNIPAREVEYRRQIGHLKGRPVFRIGSIGGLQIVAAARAGGMEILGGAPDFGVSKFLARQAEPDIVYDELSKAEDSDPRLFKEMIAEYTGVSAQLRAESLRR